MLTEFNALEASVILEPGDQLVLFTDGIVEATNPDKELFGIDRFDAELSAATTDPEELIAEVITSLLGFTGGAAPSDDRTLVIGKVE